MSTYLAIQLNEVKCALPVKLQMAGKRVKQKASFQAKTPFVEFHRIYMKLFVYTLLPVSRCFDPSPTIQKNKLKYIDGNNFNFTSKQSL